MKTNLELVICSLMSADQETLEVGKLKTASPTENQTSAM